MREMKNMPSAGKVFSYESYLVFIEKLVRNNESSGSDTSEKMVEFTRLNYHRTKRITKTFKVDSKLKDIISTVESPLNWMIIVESWCGDVPHNLPVIAAISALTDKINLQIILRDDNPEIMDQFLTNGGRSIPKLICYHSESNEVLGTWGPRPVQAQEMVIDFKKSEGNSKLALYEAIQRWYLLDKGKSIQEELGLLIKLWDINAKALNSDLIEI